jgi:pimeloyl-ACP methyl ester carboxylesterase
VAPTFAYRNWRDPLTVGEDDIALMRGLTDLLVQLPGRIGRPVDPKVIVLGFSRGAQLAHRFAETYPERTAAIAAVAAGTYTAPMALDAAGRQLRFPFGTGDLAERSGRLANPEALRQVPFWVAVGANDNNSADVPRQWDAIGGKTRVERAGSFVQQLKAIGASATLAIFPSVGHELSGDMVGEATRFLAEATSLLPPLPSAAPAVRRLPVIMPRAY